MMLKLMTQRLKLMDVKPELAKRYAEELGMKVEDVELIRKGFVSEAKDVDEEEGSFVAAISTEARDRDDEVIKADGWVLDSYRKNPVILFCHKYGMPSVGKALWLKAEKGKLLAKALFAGTALGGELKYLYTNPKDDPVKFMNAFSVGFIPLKWEDGQEKGEPRRTYLKQELLEFSAVPVPANPEALQQAVDEGKIKSKTLRIAFGIEDKGSEGKVKCQNCETLVDYVKEPEVAMGAIRCPECKATINQEGQVLPEDTAREFDNLKEFRPVFNVDKETPQGDLIGTGDCPECGKRLKMLSSKLPSSIEEVLHDAGTEQKEKVLTIKEEKKEEKTEPFLRVGDSEMTGEQLKELVASTISGVIRRLRGKVN